MHEPTFNSNTDFIDLGLVLLECMEGHPHSIDKRQLAFVKAQRALNRVFGLTQPERWSGCKQLIDFLDELFNEKRSALAKISKPVGLKPVLPSPLSNQLAAPVYFFCWG